MIAYQFYIPIVRDSDKVPHDPKHWTDLEKGLARAFRGWTRSPDVQGGWVDGGGSIVTDCSRVYSVAIEDSDAERGYFVKLLSKVKQVFDQQCIFVVRTGVATLV